MDKPKVGALVQLNLPQLFEYCERDDPEEIIKLMDRDYCSQVLKLSFPLLQSPAEAERIKAETGHSRYWTQVHHVLDHDVRVTSQWYAKHFAPFLRYLVDKGLTPLGVTPELVDAEITALAAAAVKTSSLGGARYKKTAIGVAQNAIVRNILGSLGAESFTEKDWLAVKRWFGHRCVYCSGTHQIVMDHAVPISSESLGEHRLGNLVPSCHDCNSDKKELRYDVFLRGQRDGADAEARISRIEAHMAHHSYVPLLGSVGAREAVEIRKLLAGARQQVAAAAAATVAAIEAVTSRSDPSSRP